MRWCGVVLMAACLQAVAAEGIEQVLERSQQVRLAQRAPADVEGAAAQRVRASLQRLTSVAPADAPAVELVLVGGELFAEALLDRPGIAVSQAVGELPEGERLLLLAHELGHVRLAHARALKALYREHIPGAVLPETTDRVQSVLGAQAHALSHRHEMQADAYGYAMARRLGYGIDTAFALLTRQGVQHDSATHPGTRRRFAQLRLLEAALAASQQAAEPASAEAIALAWAPD
jgi:hypothetical protein